MPVMRVNQEQLPVFLPILDTQYFAVETWSLLIELFIEFNTLPFILRAPHLKADQYLQLVAEVESLKMVFEFDYLVHKHLDLHTQTKAWGLHVTESQLATFGVHKSTPEFWGASVHSLATARLAQSLGAKYLVFGSVFSSTKNTLVVGIEALKNICKKISLPVYAIGGVNENNLFEVKHAGAAGFCAFRFLADETEHRLAKALALWEQI